MTSSSSLARAFGRFRVPITLLTLVGAVTFLVAACSGSDEYTGEVLHPDGGDVTGIDASVPGNPRTDPDGEQAAPPSLSDGSDADGSDGNGGDAADSQDASSEAATGSSVSNGIGQAIMLEPAETANVPAEAPTVDCASGCVLVLEGDSLTFGYTDWVCRELTATTCVNSGVSGARVDQMADHAPGDVDNLVSDGTNDVLVLWGGTNDLWQQFHSPDPQANAEGTYLSIMSYVDDRRAAGWDVIAVMTLPPSNPESVQGVEHLNGLIRQNLAEADIIIDVARDGRLADPFDPVLRAPDGVHYKDPGRQIVVNDNILPALRSVGLR